MAIPDYQSIMLPLLVHLGDSEIKSTQETIDELAKEFNLNDLEKKELLPSGQQPIFTNRIAWAKTYLKKSGLIESPKRGYYKITKRGLEVIRKKPDKIDNHFLTQFDDFNKFIESRKTKDIELSKESSTNELSSEKTPEELIETGYQKIRNDLGLELLSNIKECSPSFFEKLVIDLLIKMGYGGSKSEAGRTIGQTGDGGIDGIIKEDRLGLDIIYIQAKRWENTVGRPEIQKFAGALQGQRAKKGIFITTSDFSKTAKEYVSMIDSKIILIDGEQLSNYMIDFDIGVSKIANYELKKLILIILSMNKFFIEYIDF